MLSAVCKLCRQSPLYRFTLPNEKSIARIGTIRKLPDCNELTIVGVTLRFYGWLKKVIWQFWATEVLSCVGAIVGDVPLD